MELSIPYILSTSGGSCVFGNSDAAKADPNFAGFLDPDQGITGLLDGADVRAVQANLAQFDGSQLGPGWRGQRAGTIQGMLDPNVTVVQRETVAARIRRVMAGCVRADGLLLWTPTYDGVPRMLRVRCVARPDIRGRQPTTFMLTLASADAEVIAATESATQILVDAAVGGTAFTATADNVGDVEAWPIHRFDGPLSQPRISLAGATPAQTIQLSTAVLAGQYVLVIPQRAAAVRGTKTLIAPAGQLVTNPRPTASFGWTNATFWTAAAAVTYPADATARADGTPANGLSLQAAGSGAATLQGVEIALGALVAGTPYYIELYLRSTAGAPTLTVGLGEVAAAHENLVVAAGVVPGATFTKVSGVVTPTHSGAFVLYVRQPAAVAATWRLQAAMVIASPIAVPYRDGTMKYDYGWTGTADASTTATYQDDVARVDAYAELVTVAGGGQRMWRIPPRVLPLFPTVSNLVGGALASGTGVGRIKTTWRTSWP